MPKLIDLNGRVFGRLTVKERGPNDWRNHARWWCVCSCGNPERVLVLSYNLTSRAYPTRSCGCLKRENVSLAKRGRTPSTLVDMRGRTFGRLTVKKCGPNETSGQPRWWCDCSCGNPARILVRAGNLVAGRSRSCGCLRHHPD